MWDDTDANAQYLTSNELREQGGDPRLNTQSSFIY